MRFPPAVLTCCQAPAAAERIPRAAKPNTFAGSDWVRLMPSARVLSSAEPEAVRLASGPSRASENGSRLRSLPKAFLSMVKG
ncbi:MAG: hypothetical protein BWX54_02347 [Verrucomicrobia bacterium ADurb.Bin018]|nr:MAG: hypothetical protein BWX54_02347 [Verrucomicrobia bacterium ADurb.Bin018]